MKLSADVLLLIPADVVTMMSTVPADCAGLTAVIDVEEFTVMLVAAVPPNITVGEPVKLVPVIVTDVPPAVEPLDGLSPVIVGGEGAT